MRTIRILSGELFPSEEPSPSLLLEAVLTASDESDAFFEFYECPTGCESIEDSINEYQPDVIFLTASVCFNNTEDAVTSKYMKIASLIKNTGVILALPFSLLQYNEQLYSRGIGRILSLKAFRKMAEDIESNKTVCRNFCQEVKKLSRSAADYMVECLQRQRVRFVFGVPGSEILPVIRGFQKDHISHGIKFILTASEQGAAFMADTIGRLSPGRVPGVCMSTLGPGATNLITGVANAWEDKSPMVVINGQAPSSRSGKESHQIENTLEMFSPFVTYRKAIQSNSAEEIASAVANAFRKSRMERPRPSVLEIPVDIQRQRCSGPFSVPIIKPYEYPDPRTFDPLQLPQAGELVIQEAALALARAKRPVIIVGPGATRPAENQGELQISLVLREFVERLKIPVTHTFMGKGVVDETSCEYVLPVAGGTQNDTDYDLFNSIFDASDLIITVGYDFHEFDCRVWNRFRGSEENQANIINISYIAPQVEAFYLPRWVLSGSLAYNLEALKKHGLALLYEQGSFHWHKSGWLSIGPVLNELLKEERDAIVDSRGNHFIRDVIRHLKSLEGKLLKDENRRTLFISDTGLHKMWLSRYLKASRPDSFLVPNGFSPMGYAIPAAVGASFLFYEDEVFNRKKLKEVQPLVVSIMGDGCFRMSAFEISTAVHYHLPIVFILINDNNLGLIEAKERNSYGTATSEALNLPVTDYLKIAEGMGANAVSTDLHNLKRNIREASSLKNKPTVIVLEMEQENVHFSCILRNHSLSRRKKIRERVIELTENCTDSYETSRKIRREIRKAFRMVDDGSKKEKKPDT